MCAADAVLSEPGQGDFSSALLRFGRHQTGVRLRWAGPIAAAAASTTIAGAHRLAADSNGATIHTTSLFGLYFSRPQLTIHCVLWMWIDRYCSTYIYVYRCDDQTYGCVPIWMRTCACYRDMAISRPIELDEIVSSSLAYSTNRTKSHILAYI